MAALNCWLVAFWTSIKPVQHNVNASLRSDSYTDIVLSLIIIVIECWGNDGE